MSNSSLTGWMRDPVTSKVCVKPLKALPGDSSAIIRGCDCTSSVFDLSLSNEPQWVEVNTEPAGSTGLWKPSGDTTECVEERKKKREPFLCLYACEVYVP